MQFLPRIWIYILTCNLTRNVNPGKWHSTDFRIWRTRSWRLTYGWSSTGATTSWPGSPRSTGGSRVSTCRLITSGDRTLSSTTSECPVINIQYISLTSTSKVAQYKTFNIPERSHDGLILGVSYETLDKQSLTVNTVMSASENIAHIH